MPVPTQKTMKRLFGPSGNQCAFPKCDAPMIVGETVLGEVCHLMADSPGGPRYNSNQSDEERNSYSNLILLCSSHHKVIDDDVEAYSIERLRSMKEKHESRVAHIPETEAAEGGSLLFSIGQRGGITVQSVHGNTINIHPAQAASEAEPDARILSARAHTIHRDCCSLIQKGEQSVILQSATCFVFHVIPDISGESSVFQSRDDFQTVSNFPPVGSDRPRDWRLTYDGLLVGSNAGGLDKNQRAYTLWSNKGYIEAVFCFGEGERSTGAIELAKIQFALCRWSYLYMKGLNYFGARHPTFIFASLLGAKGLIFMQEELKRSYFVDMPSSVVPNNSCYFGHVRLDKMPQNMPETENFLAPLLVRLANTAGLSNPPILFRK